MHYHLFQHEGSISQRCDQVGSSISFPTEEAAFAAYDAVVEMFRTRRFVGPSAMGGAPALSVNPEQARRLALNTGRDAWFRHPDGDEIYLAAVRIDDDMHTRDCDFYLCDDRDEYDEKPTEQGGCQSLTCCSTREEQRIHEAENEEAFDDPTPYTVEIDDLTEEQATALRRQLMELLPDLAEQVNVYKWNGSDDEGCVESAQHDLERAQVAKPTFEQIVEARVGPPMVYGTVEQGKTFPEGARRIPVQGYEQGSI